MVKVAVGVGAVCATLEVLGTLRVASVGPAEQRPTGGRLDWVVILELRCCLLVRTVCSVEAVDRVEKAHL